MNESINEPSVSRTAHLPLKNTQIYMSLLRSFLWLLDIGSCPSVVDCLNSSHTRQDKFSNCHVF